MSATQLQHPKKNHRMADGLQGLWLSKGSLRWRFDGFSGVRASFHSVILTLIVLAQRICTEEKTTASGEAKFIRKRWIEMLWAIRATAFIGGVFVFWLISRHLKKGQKRGIDIAC